MRARVEAHTRVHNLEEKSSLTRDLIAVSPRPPLPLPRDHVYGKRPVRFESVLETTRGVAARLSWVRTSVAGCPCISVFSVVERIAYIDVLIHSVINHIENVTQYHGICKENNKQKMCIWMHVDGGTLLHNDPSMWLQTSIQMVIYRRGKIKSVCSSMIITVHN